MAIWNKKPKKDIDLENDVTSNFEEILEKDETISISNEDYDHDLDIDEIEVDMQDNFIEMHHRIGDKTINLRYCGRSQEITIFSEYTQDEFATIYPQIDTRVISLITSVFIDLRYYGHDFYSGDFEATLKNWLGHYVFNRYQRKNVELVKYLIEKETKNLLRDLSNTRLDKCWNNDQFTPLIWASAEQIKKLYDHHEHWGAYKENKEQ